MLTFDDFKQAAANRIENYPALMPLFKAQDPRLMATLDAMAGMLSLLSSQLDVAIAEPFEKNLPATVLADASLRGILPKAMPARVRIKVLSSGTSENITIATGRKLLDANNREYQVVLGATVLPETPAYIEATQVISEQVIHTVANTQPFYAVEIESEVDGYFLSGLSVSDNVGSYAYKDVYTNSELEERVFTLETDAQGGFFIKFGATGLAGYQPPNGTELTITVQRSLGDISLNTDSPFSFQYLVNPLDSKLTLTFDSIVTAGKNPFTLSQLRDLCKYPSIYNKSAVLNGNFEYLVRENFPELKFLSVWGEAIEEVNRGADLDNINTLFIACKKTTEATLTESTNAVTPPEIINSLSAVQKNIKTKVLAADNSYKIRFYKPIIVIIELTITAKVSFAYGAADVSAKVKALLISAFGIDAMKGQKKILTKGVYELLRVNIAALMDVNSDLTVTITPHVESERPELWRYVTEDSLTVTVTNTVTSIPSW